MKLSENARRHIGETITIRWGTSRGRDTYGYTTCSLRNHQGKRVAACNGGGYDMKGTVIGHWVAVTFHKELCSLKPESFPRESHWEPSRNPRRFCLNAECNSEDGRDFLPPDVDTCPKCGRETFADPRDGRRVDDGPRFYGLTFHDPNYDPGKAVIGQGCDDRTLGAGSEGKTVEQAESDGDSLGLERYQAFYRASSPIPTERHTVPIIDGACGIQSVMAILNAIGLDLRHLVHNSKLDVYEIIAAK